MPTTLGFRHHLTIGLLAQSGRGFSLPVDVALGPDGVLYVLNRGNQVQRNAHVTMCTIESEHLGDFGECGTGEGAFIWPTAIATDRDGQVYIASESEHRILTFSHRGQFLGSWGTLGDRDGELDGPSGLAFDRRDNLYVVDHANNRVQKFTKQGQFLLKWGEKGDGDGQFNLPWGIGLDAAGQVYVADWGNNRVQVLQPDGSFLLKLRGDATLSQWAQEFLPANPDYMQERSMARNREVERYFWGPTAVKLDPEGQLYVGDSCRHRLQIYRRVH